ncbi:MAG: hypothetical protein JO259_17625 [Mycobacterium sp.]|nr:hypothetical protein [Mycobacterium sp.]
MARLIRVDGKLVADKTKIRYNSRIELSDIAEEVQRYELGPRTAAEWLIERYQVRTDKDSGIVNDPNHGTREKNSPRFVLDLVVRIVTVSVETVKVVEAPPALDIPSATCARAHLKPFEGAMARGAD